MFRAISMTTMLFFITGAQADILPDVLCATGTVIDAGFGIELMRHAGGKYTGQLVQHTFVTDAPTPLGTVKIERANPSAVCELIVSNDVQSQDSFQMKFLGGSQIAQLTNLDGRPVNEWAGIMNCKFTNAALNDVRTLCGDY